MAPLTSFRGMIYSLPPFDGNPFIDHASITTRDLHSTAPLLPRTPPQIIATAVVSGLILITAIIIVFMVYKCWARTTTRDEPVVSQTNADPGNEHAARAALAGTSSLEFGFAPRSTREIEERALNWGRNQPRSDRTQGDNVVARPAAAVTRGADRQESPTPAPAPPPCKHLSDSILLFPIFGICHIQKDLLCLLSKPGYLEPARQARRVLCPASPSSTAFLPQRSGS
ncbi:hypothetical protein J7T55_003903 [Diaporthe amygdali]|uniref:uncharacterized protein n=1 Tax=Phomopsis amygdali TaxID=1214568 RepID=UPI0022FE028C|nr:uncharacterized protein J7T55_003903 [Diaporthe amygdali]KAJ0117487.1 hypothetical protein J7T55_003903 [Diaporthe amygdali]